MIEHKNIPDSELHEPKGIATATTKEIYVADGTGSGDWRKINELDIDYSNKTKNQFGWIDIADNLYTSGAPRALTATVRYQITNNGLAAQTDISRLPAIWDSGANQFQINDLNAAYLLRLRFAVKTASAAGTPYIAKIELESNSGPTTISAVDQVFKGGNYENAVGLSIPFYSGSFINNIPLKLFITTDTNSSIYNIGFVIQRLYKET